MHRFITLLMVCTLTSGLSLSGNEIAVQKEKSSQSQVSTTGKYIKDLKIFVRSIGRQKYQPESYWKEVDELWESLQLRKQDLEGMFSNDQLKQIRKWEKRYSEIRRKRSKLS